MIFVVAKFAAGEHVTIKSAVVTGVLGYHLSDESCCSRLGGQVLRNCG